MGLDDESIIKSMIKSSSDENTIKYLEEFQMKEKIRKEPSRNWLNLDELVKEIKELTFSEPNPFMLPQVTLL